MNHYTIDKLFFWEYEVVHDFDSAPACDGQVVFSSWKVVDSVSSEFFLYFFSILFVSAFGLIEFFYDTFPSHLCCYLIAAGSGKDGSIPGLSRLPARTSTVQLSRKQFLSPQVIGVSERVAPAWNRSMNRKSPTNCYWLREGHGSIAEKGDGGRGDRIRYVCVCLLYWEYQPQRRWLEIFFTICNSFNEQVDFIEFRHVFFTLFKALHINLLRNVLLDFCSQMSMAYPHIHWSYDCFFSFFFFQLILNRRQRLEKNKRNAPYK